MAADIPTTEPASLRAGDTWKWLRTLDDYPASAPWTLKYRFKNAAGGFEIVASASGNDHAVSVTAATTAAYAAGSYTWTAWVEGGSSEKYSVGEGTLDVLPDYRAGVATVALEDRSHAAKMLAAIEAWLEARDPAVAEYEIAGRRMKYIPAGELVKLRNRYQAEVANERAAAELAAGLGTGRKIQFRL